MILLQGSAPSVGSAINKEDWFIKKAHYKHNHKYTYPNFKYTGDGNLTSILSISIVSESVSPNSLK